MYYDVTCINCFRQYETTSEHTFAHKNEYFCPLCSGIRYEQEQLAEVIDAAVDRMIVEVAQR